MVTLDTTMLGWRARDLDLASLPFLRGRGSRSTRAIRCSDACSSAGRRRARRGLRPTRRPRCGRSSSSRAGIPGRFWRTSARGGRAPPCGASSRSTRGRRSRGTTCRFLRELDEAADPAQGRPARGRRAARARARRRRDRRLQPRRPPGRRRDRRRSTRCPASSRPSAGAIPVLLDSGVRGGADAFKALALGARAVLIGRPYAYGLAIAGEAGVREVLANFVADFDLTMGLAGCASIAEITPAPLTGAGHRPGADDCFACRQAAVGGHRRRCPTRPRRRRGRRA